MEQSQQSKTVLTALVVLAVIVAGYFLMQKYESGEAEPGLANEVQSESKASLPEGMPFEENAVVNSASTHYTEEVPDSRQVTLAYKSAMSVEEKYAEYKAYMEQAGFKIKENASNSSSRTLFGINGEANLSVVISNTDGTTLVQLAYLDKSL